MSDKENDRTKIDIAKIGCYSAVLVAVIGCLGSIIVALINVGADEIISQLVGQPTPTLTVQVLFITPTTPPPSIPTTPPPPTPTTPPPPMPTTPPPPTPTTAPPPPTEALQGPLVQIIGPGLSQSTGFAIADTPYIVIRNIVWQEGDRVDFIVASDQTSTLRSATVEASDRELLIALLRPIGEPLTRGMQLVSANRLEVGTPVTLFSLHRERYVPGTVEGLDAQASIALPDGTITLSGVIRTSKMGEAGDSGTPLNDAAGRTVGVIVAGSTDASLAVTTDQLCEAFQRYLLDACP